jgi:hypothetical protein
MALLTAWVSQQRTIVMGSAVLLYNNHAATLVIERPQINHNAALSTSTTVSLFVEGLRGRKISRAYHILYNIKYTLS